MPKSEKQKIKTLYVAKFFLENSDENHAVTANDILQSHFSPFSISAYQQNYLFFNSISTDWKYLATPYASFNGETKASSMF